MRSPLCTAKLCQGAAVSLGLRVLPAPQKPSALFTVPELAPVRSGCVCSPSLNVKSQKKEKQRGFFPPLPSWSSSLSGGILCCSSRALEEAARWCFSLCSSCCLRCGRCTGFTWLCPATLLLSFLSGGPASSLERFLAFLLLFIFYFLWGVGCR